jgi:YhcH/YjgK/YiaL family protein
MPKISIKNDEVCIIHEYLTKDENSSLLEAHKKYIDIQYVIQGEEIIGIAMLSSTLEATEYSQERDIIFLNGKHE